MFLYPVQTRQQLSETNKNSRVALAQLCKENLEKSPNFLDRIVFSGECSFLLQGAVNKQKCGVWGPPLPEIVYESLRNSPMVICWCHNFRPEVIGPYLFDNGSATGHRYKKMLRYYLFPKLAIHSFEMTYQQDGASLQYALVNRHYLDRKHSIE